MKRFTNIFLAGRIRTSMKTKRQRLGDDDEAAKIRKTTKIGEMRRNGKGGDDDEVVEGEGKTTKQR